jgi:hypothetical protein
MILRTTELSIVTQHNDTQHNGIQDFNVIVSITALIITTQHNDPGHNGTMYYDKS